MFLFPQSDDISGGLPQGIGFGEREIYILAKGYFFGKVLLSLSYYKMGLKNLGPNVRLEVMKCTVLAKN